MGNRMRRSPGPHAQSRKRQTLSWIVAGLSVAAFVVVSVSIGRGGVRSHHPTPRPASEQPDVVPAANYARYPRVSETYRMAAAVKAELDGIYCYCDCAHHSGHYSLLDCFTSDHAARCDVCMSEAVIAYRMTRNGATLNQIRAEVDNMYGT